MKLVRYVTDESDEPAVGYIVDGRIVPTGYSSMSAFIADGGVAGPTRRPKDAEDIDMGAARLLAPLADPGKMLFLGRTFAAFRQGLADDEPPFVYARVASSIIGPGETIEHPGPGQNILYEGELLVVIGRVGRRISADDALSHVFGYTQVNDITWTNWIHGGETSLPQITLCKNADTFCPMGPSIVTADEYEPAEVGCTVTVNDEVRTTTSMSEMVWSISALIEFLSRDMTLWPGDVIATGTSDAQELVPGDRVVVEHDGLGTLANVVSAR